MGEGGTEALLDSIILGDRKTVWVPQISTEVIQGKNGRCLAVSGR